MFFKTLLSGEQLSSLPGAFLTEETMKLHPVGISSEWPVYWKEMSIMAHMLYWLRQKWWRRDQDGKNANWCLYMEEMDATFTQGLNLDYHMYCLVLRVRINLQNGFFYGTAKLPIPPLLTSFPTKTHYTKPSKQQSTSPPTCFSPSHSVPSLPDLIIQTAVLPDHLVHTPPLSSSKVTQAHFSLARNIWAEGTQIILAATRGKRFQSTLVKMWQPMEF